MFWDKLSGFSVDHVRSRARLVELLSRTRHAANGKAEAVSSNFCKSATGAPVMKVRLGR
jgi:hypothetical protein